MLTFMDWSLEVVAVGMAVVMFGMGVGLLACIPFVSRW